MGYWDKMITQNEANKLSENFINMLADRKFYQADAAFEYAKLIAYHQIAVCDWTVINAAIINRWSLSGLKRVKIMAWNNLEVIYG